MLSTVAAPDLSHHSDFIERLRSVRDVLLVGKLSILSRIYWNMAEQPHVIAKSGLLGASYYS